MGRRFLIMGFYLILGLLLTNCQKGFKSKIASTSTLEMSTVTPEILTANGQLLYESNCASCHAPIANSTKKNRTFAQIVDSIKEVPTMKFLSPLLTDNQIIAIEKALENKVVNEVDPHLDFVCDATSLQQRGSTQTLIKRFTKQELVNTLRSLLGDTIFNDTSIQTELAKITPDIMAKQATDIGYSASSYYFTSLYTTAKRAATLILANPQEKTKVFGSCASVTPVTSACINSFITNFGLKAYRRPVTTSESTSHTNLWAKIIASANNSNEAFKALYIKFISSPQMSFHIEEGTGEIVNGKTRLTDYEVASRISYMASGTMPDSLLFEAAKTGVLKTLTGVRDQTLRMLNSAGSSLAKTDEFISYYGGFEQIETPFAPAALNQGIDLTNLPSEMKQEALEFSRYAIWNKRATYEGFITSSDVFPRSDRMSKILKTPIFSGTIPPKAPPENSGFFVRPAFLASAYDRTHIIRRGIHLREKIFCSLGQGTPATASEIEAAKQLVPDLPSLTNRQGVAAITSSVACVSCHAKFNPPGFLLENYDQLGKFRTTESLFDSTGAIVKSFPIDSKVDDTGFETGKSQPAMDAIDMIRELSLNNNAKACFAKKMMTFYRTANPEPSIDNCTLAEIYKTAKTGTIIDIITATIANEDIFWKKKGL